MTDNPNKKKKPKSHRVGQVLERGPMMADPDLHRLQAERAKRLLQQDFPRHEDGRREVAARRPGSARSGRAARRSRYNLRDAFQ